ncbi:hypothetical protein KUCAC02_022069 [Chaenocephalus aceratus]|nr:hypothetical protein KUCAC02_022069 [Chaenocephalus aceratus]
MEEHRQGAAVVWECPLSGSGAEETLLLHHSRRLRRCRGPVAADHEEERINIYCLSCETPTCSMCKVFGKHKACDVAPLSSVYLRQKTDLSDGIAMLVANNDHIQTLISEMEEMCCWCGEMSMLKENGQRQRERLEERFEALVNILDERKQDLVGLISKRHDDTLRSLRSLIGRHSEQLEAAVALLEAANPINGGATHASRPEVRFESASHFVLDTDDLAELLRNIHFSSGNTSLTKDTHTHTHTHTHAM